MTALAQRALPFECAEPLLYHPPERGGFISLLQRGASVSGKRQRTIKLEALPEVLERMHGAADVWISQGEFFRPNRRVVNLWRMPLAFADLDTYHEPGLVSLPTHGQVELMLMACDDRRIPPPSVVVFSGRGLQVKWLFTSPVPRGSLMRWQALQRQLNSMLLDFGADARALDASRVLRLVDTTSSRTDEWIRVVHTTRTPTMGGAVMPSGVVGYDFDVFADTVLPVARIELEEQQAQRERNRQQDALEKAAREARRSNFVVVPGAAGAGAEKPSGLRSFIPSELAWARLEDLRTLARLRGHEDGLPPGERDTFVFLAACFLTQARLVRDVKSEIMELASEFAPTWSESDARSCVGSAVARAEQASRGEKVLFKGRELDPRYRWRNETLVDRLGITAAEALELQTILPADEAKRRDAQRQMDRRRAAGAVARAEYLGQAGDRRQQALQLQREGHSQRAIARQLGVSPAAVCGYLKG